MSDVTQKILRAGLEVFRERGVRGASMSAIAARAGVSRPTVYARFPNKDAALVAITRDVFEQAIAEVREVFASNDTLEDALTRALDAYFGRLHQEMLMFSHGEELQAAWERLAQEIVEEARVEMTAHLTGALERAGALHVSETVELLLLTPRALKGPGVDNPTYRARLARFASVVARGCL